MSCGSSSKGIVQTTKVDNQSYRDKLNSLNSNNSNQVVRSSRTTRPVVSEIEIEKATKIYDLDYDISIEEDFDSDLTQKIIAEAFKYHGVRYRLGGLTHNGIDCSGLMLKSFQQHNIQLPRTSLEMSRMGRRLNKNEVRKGDLVFFKTSRRGVVSHVGLVTEINGNEIKFIHASSSKGVIVSSINEDYYTRTYSHATRII